MARGDFIGAEMQAAEVTDRSPGRSACPSISFIHSRGPRPRSYRRLANWLAQYADLSKADRIFALAANAQPQA